MHHPSNGNLTTLEQVEVALGRLASARQAAAKLDPATTEAAIVNASLETLSKLLLGVETLVGNSDALRKRVVGDGATEQPDDSSRDIS